MHNFFVFFLLFIASISSCALNHPIKTHPAAGLFDASQEDSESLVEYFFRHNILKLNSDFKSASINENTPIKNNKNIQFIWHKILLKNTTSPFKIIVKYNNNYKTKIERIIFESCDTIDTYHDADSIEAYLNKTIEEINNRYTSGYQAISYTFEQAQNNRFIKRTTLMGEQLHICGVTQNIEELLIAQLLNFSRDHKIIPLKIFYYGSRVMPRTEVIKRDPALADNLPIQEGGLIKNAVRISGLTNISDLEMVIVFSSPSDFSQKEITWFNKQFKKFFAQFLREFPVSVRFIQAKTDNPTRDIFSHVQNLYATRNKFLSPYQFVEVPF